VCTGFDSTKDISFRPGIHLIFYAIKNDTVNLYSNYIPALPDRFPNSIRTTQLNVSEANEYEDSFKNGKISKIVFDTVIYKTPCDALLSSPVDTMKFKPRP